MAVILAMIGRLWITKATSLRCCIARLLACPNKPNPVTSVAAWAWNLCIKPAAAGKRKRFHLKETQSKQKTPKHSICLRLKKSEDAAPVRFSVAMENMASWYASLTSSFVTTSLILFQRSGWRNGKKKHSTSELYEHFYPETKHFALLNIHFCPHELKTKQESTFKTKFKVFYSIFL